MRATPLQLSMLASVLAICAANCPDRGQSACFTSNVGQIRIVPGLTVDQCCAECGLSAECKAWQFVAAEGGSSQSTCDLRRQKPDRVPGSCISTGASPGAPTPGPRPRPTPGPPGPTPGPPGPSPVGQTLPSIPGMLTTSAKEGSLFAKGFDPTLAQSRHAVLDFHFTNSSWRAWGQPESGSPFALPDEVFIYDIPATQMDNQAHAIGNLSSYREYQYQYHWSALILIIVNAAKLEAQGYVKWLVEETFHEMMLSEQYTTSFKVDLLEPSVLKQQMQHGGLQSQSAFVREQALLPSTRTSAQDKEAYHTFIQKFGTHYASSAVYGSMLEMILSSSSKVVEKMDLQWSVQAKALLGWMLVAFARLEASASVDIKLSALFTEDVNLVLSAYGGDVTTIASGDYAAW